jgi:gliding motility-associated-like protein
VNLKKTIFFIWFFLIKGKITRLLPFLLFVFQEPIFSQVGNPLQTEICLWKLPGLTDTFLCPGQNLLINLDTLAGRLKKDTFRFNPITSLDGNIHRPLSPLKIKLSVKDLPKERIDFKDYQLAQICLDIFTPRASDLEVWMLPPSGNIDHLIELISPGNATNAPDFIQTCFTSKAQNPLSSGTSPYTGTFSAAGNWSGLSGEALNGEWQLWVSDRFADPLPGLVQSISLVFETKPEYKVKWAPKEGISCDTCKKSLFSPVKSTTYTLEMLNHAGCVFKDTFQIDFRDDSFGPTLTCEPKGPGLMDVSWQLPALLAGETYVGSVVQKGKPPIALSATGNKSYIINGLSAGDSILVTLKLPKIEKIMCQEIDTTFTCVFPSCELALSEKQNTPISCFGSEDGILEFSQSKGIPPISFTKDGQAVPWRIERLKAGTHSFTATDLIGCQTSISAQIKEPQPISANITQTNPVLCYDQAGGRLRANPAGGNGGYTYRWQPEGGTSATTNYIKQGRYQLIITDSKSCVGKDSFLLDAPPPMLATATPTPTKCFGSSTGSIAIKVSGGVAPYEYLWNNGKKSADLTDLPAGPYQVTVTDKHSCQVIVPVTVAQGANILKIDSSLITPVSCYGKSDGYARVFVSGGTKPYLIKWSDPFAQIGQLANRLSTGSYGIAINDANGCTLQHTVLMTSPTLLQMNIQTRDLTCLNRNDGELEVFPFGGTLPYKILWSDGRSENKKINLAVGNYSLTLTDANNCEVRDGAMIRNPENPLKISAIQTYKGCFGKKENTVQTTVSGGNPDYFIRWSHGFTGPLSSSLDTTLYLIKVNDARGCLDSTFIKPVDLPNLVPEITIKDPSCHNDQNGSVSLQRIRGREGVDVNLFRYQWSSGQRTPEVKGLLGAENYILTVTDTKGCTGSAGGYMRNPTPVSLILEGRDPICHGGKDGKIWLKSLQSEANLLTYSWNAANQAGARDTIFNLGVGNYSLTITNVNGCKGSSSLNLKEPTPILTQHIKKGNSCFGYREGEAEIKVSGGNPNYQIKWNDGNSSFKRTNLMGGTYHITITDAGNCQKLEQVDIFQPEQTILDFHLDSISCYKAKDGILSFAIFGGKGPFVYSFDKSKWQTGNRISNLGQGTYTLYLKDANSCHFDTTFTIPEPPFFNIDIGNEIIRSSPKQNIRFQPLLFNGQEPIKFRWTLSDSSALSCLNCQNTVLSASRSMDIKLTATDRKGCIAQDVVKVLVIQNRNVLIPTAFSPNNDKQNDLLLIHGEYGVKIIEFKIYDRLGNMVYQDADFSTNERERGWNGTFRQKDSPVGNYEWFCTVKYPDGYQDYLRGQTQLIR